MSFDAGAQVEPLDYNFDTIASMYPGKYPGLVGVKGTTPEPSDEAVQKLQRQLTDGTRGLLPDDLDQNDAAAVAKAMRAIPDEQFREAEAAIIDAVAELTAGEPTRDQIAELPFRIRRKYIQWLQKELMNPEPLTAATKD